MMNVEAADENYLKAITIYSAHFPNTTNYAICLCNYGNLLLSRGRRAEAVTRLEAALQLFLHQNNQDGANRCQSVLQQLRK